jgi:hypothetical protein
MYTIRSYTLQANFDAQVADSSVRVVELLHAERLVEDRYEAFTFANAQHRAGLWVALFDAPASIEATYTH